MAELSIKVYFKKKSCFLRSSGCSCSFSLSCPGLMWNLPPEYCIYPRVFVRLSITCEYMWGRGWVCLQQRRLLVKYDLWKKKKKFPVRILLLELQSITFRYRIHPNRCSVLNDTGPWQPATDESVARDQVHKHTHLHTLHIFTGALCCSYHPHHLQQWGKWELHAVTVIWWKFSEFSLIYLFSFYLRDVTQVFEDVVRRRVRSVLWLAAKLSSELYLKHHFFLPHPEASDQ